MIKVCSYRRSGSHLLMASLAANFNFAEDLSRELHSHGRKWITEGSSITVPLGTKVIVPWGKLFGTRKMDTTDINDPILYIIRNPLDVMRSCYEFDGCRGTINEYATDERIQYWLDHVNYFTANHASVQYESLVTLPIKTIQDIQKVFQLHQKQPHIEVIDRNVGWKAKKQMGERAGWRLSTIDRFRGIIGAKFKGYEI